MQGQFAVMQLAAFGDSSSNAESRLTNRRGSGGLVHEQASTSFPVSHDIEDLTYIPLISPILFYSIIGETRHVQNRYEGRRMCAKSPSCKSYTDDAVICFVVAPENHRRDDSTEKLLGYWRWW